MSVIIKGMEMPNNCERCPFLDYEEGFCFASGEKGENGWYEFSLWAGGDKTNRHTNCPLVELPTPHGRLIDIDRAFDYVKAVHTLRHSINESALEIIFNSPTVIEAEE